MGRRENRQDLQDEQDCRTRSGGEGWASSECLGAQIAEIAVCASDIAGFGFDDVDEALGGDGACATCDRDRVAILSDGRIRTCSAAAQSDRTTFHDSPN